MKKLFVMLCGLFLTAATTLVAQNAVNGTVTDKDGNPIPGVKVEVVGSNESVLTELDGTFQLNTRFPAKKVKVHYAGMQSKTQKIKPDMAIKMYNSSWWREKPEKYQWFVGAQVAVPDIDKMGNMSYGLMFGRVKNFGWYVKALWSPRKSCEGYGWEEDYGSDWTTGKYQISYWAATGGLMYRLWSPVYLYAGAGYSDHQFAYELYGGEYLEHELYEYGSLAIDLGLMVKYKRFFLNAGIILNNDWHHYKDRVGSFGIGMFF